MPLIFSCMISPLNLFYFWLVRKACLYLILMSAFNSGQSTAFHTVSTLVPGFLCALPVPLVKVSLLHSGMPWLTIHFPGSPFPLSPLAQRQEVLAAGSGMEEEGTSPVDLLFLPASLRHASSPAGNGWIHPARAVAERASLHPWDTSTCRLGSRPRGWGPSPSWAVLSPPGLNFTSCSPSCSPWILASPTSYPLLPALGVVGSLTLESPFIYPFSETQFTSLYLVYS